MLDRSPGWGDARSVDALAEIARRDLGAHTVCRQEAAVSAGNKAGLLISDALLQFEAPDAVAARLGELKAVAQSALFVIVTRYSVAPLSEGQNQHRTVETPEWWRTQIGEVYGDAFLLPEMPAGLCTVLTWRPSPAMLERVQAAKVAAKRRAKWQRRAERLRGLWYRVLRRQRCETDLHEALADRRVALVGNAASLNERDYGPAIDAADIVVRCNRGILVNAKSHGYRTDWITTGVALSEEFVVERGITTILWASRRPKMMREIPAWMYASGRMCLFPRGRNKQLKRTLGRVASTGFKAFDSIARSQCRSLDIYGFDFAVSNSSSEPTRGMSPDHDFAAESRRARALIASDARITLHP